MTTDLVLLALGGALIVAAALFSCGAALAIDEDVSPTPVRRVAGASLMTLGTVLFVAVFWVAS